MCVCVCVCVCIYMPSAPSCALSRLQQSRSIYVYVYVCIYIYICIYDMEGAAYDGFAYGQAVGAKLRLVETSAVSTRADIDRFIAKWRITVFFFFFLSLMSYTHTQKSRAQSEKHCRRRGASSGQKTRGCIEGEEPGRRRYWEVLPLEQKVERIRIALA